MQTAQDVIAFWFDECSYQDWFGADPDFDARLAERFAETQRRVAMGEAWTWRATPHGRLAEIVVLDQFSRQLFRGRREAFAADPMALALAQELVARGDDLALTPDQRSFAYMPYMHSESALVHEQALRLFAALGNEDALRFEREHAEVIARFGRYPLRNKALGRVSTPAELAYIASRDKNMF